jgi:thermostable 8-oxoguanine DNA glycosylase
MVDPRNVINYNRTNYELEEHFLFCLVVAGKTAQTQARLLNNFLNSLPDGDTPFKKIKKAIDENTLDKKVIESRLGQYTRLIKAFKQGLTLDLKNCTVKDLEAINGIGPKTARMFILQTRENQRVAAIDTHVLKFLASKGYDVPKSTPSGDQYIKLENIFINLADEANMTPSVFDLEIWKSYQKQNKNLDNK